MTRLSSVCSFRCFPAMLLAAWLAGCSGGFERIDRNVDALLQDTTSDMQGQVTPSITRLHDEPTANGPGADRLAERLPTRNPAASDLTYTPQRDVQELTQHFGQESIELDEAMEMDLNAALVYAMRNSREYRFAEEEYVLAALRLLIERHLWGPRFFNDTSAIFTAAGDDGFFDTSMRVVNELSVTQRLPYGGQVSASALARASEDLHRRVSNGGSQSADIIVSAQVPLLRGAGHVAREGRIQAEREVIYAARQFEQFRREFLFSVTTDFLGLVVQSQAIDNARRQVESLEWLEARAQSFLETGRETAIDLALAQRSTLFARDTLNGQIESFRLSLDRFKVRLGMPLDQPLAIVRSNPELPVPDVTLEEAVRRALTYRLDLQSRRDQLDDARRRLDNARNALLPDLNISGSAGMSTDPSKRRGGLGFQPENSDFEAAITLGLPLDREIERIGVRQAQISLERSVRDYQQFRDQLAVETRGAVRAIGQATFSVRIQEENVRIAERAEEAIRADPDRATPRDRTEAVDALLRAQDQLDRAKRDLQVAILRYLLQSGQLRVSSDGTIQPLRGMDDFDADPQDALPDEVPQTPPDELLIESDAA
jgi:outer membrane protein TolC